MASREALEVKRDEGTVNFYRYQIQLLLFHIDAKAASNFSDMVREHNKQERLKNLEQTWPPDQPNNFAPLVLIRHHNCYTMKQGQDTLRRSTAFAKLIQTGDQVTSLANDQSVPKCDPKPDNLEEEVLDGGVVTKNISEILAPLDQHKDPQFVLIEGAPGIGKSMLLKEIAYRWSEGMLLKTFKIVILICLRNPVVQRLVSLSNLPETAWYNDYLSLVKDFLQLFCKRDVESDQVATGSRDYLNRNNGKDLAFLLDGFDEFPGHLQKDSLIAEILHRKLFQDCAIIVSSRPHASIHLRQHATTRVEVLGFTEIERRQFIQQALQGNQERIEELSQYLQHHFNIDTLCYVPFHMVILVFLYKQKVSLPNNSAELYNLFICITICRHLAKHGQHHDNRITDLTDLPKPCKNVIQQLSKLSLESLNNNELVFTLDKIKEVCPEIEDIPGAINGFGLLQAIQHIDLTGNTMTFNFLHLYIQEFLAAHHITTLSPKKELKILRKKFSSDVHFNMFAIYVAHTRGQRPSFKRFIKPPLQQRFKQFLSRREVSLSNHLLTNQLKCFYLFHCFFEAEDRRICASIDKAKIFDNATINLENIKLSPSDVQSMAFYLTKSSHKNWKWLNLKGSFIQDHGLLRMLHRGLASCNITIAKLWLSDNGLTKASSSAVGDVVISCKVEELRIDDNPAIGEGDGFYSILSYPSSVLQRLDMYSVKLSPIAAIKLFTALTKNKQLRQLLVCDNNITDEAGNAIITAMKENTFLVELRMWDNPISGDCAQCIVQALKDNNTLQLLFFPRHFTQKVNKTITSLAKEVIEERGTRGCHTKLEIDFISI